ncbi:MAG: helix-turn-helix domain-containing protein [Candidatus Scalindua sp.]
MSVKWEPIEKSCGNVFDDLGLENAEALQAKAIMAVAILKIIKRRRLTQAKAAKLLGTSQAHISRIKNGNLEGYTYDRLVGWLNKLGIDVELSIKRVPKSREFGTVRVAV